MGNLRRMAVALCLAALLAAVRAEASPPPGGPALVKAPDEIAQRAGSAAGLAAACGDDPVPVRAAFAVYLGHRHTNSGEQQRLWSRLSLAESSAIHGISGTAAPACDGVHETMLREVRWLERVD